MYRNVEDFKFDKLKAENVCVCENMKILIVIRVTVYSKLHASSGVQEPDMFCLI